MGVQVPPRAHRDCGPIAARIRRFTYPSRGARGATEARVDTVWTRDSLPASSCPWSASAASSAGAARTPRRGSRGLDRVGLMTTGNVCPCSLPIVVDGVTAELTDDDHPLWAARSATCTYMYENSYRLSRTIAASSRSSNTSATVSHSRSHGAPLGRPSPRPPSSSPSLALYAPTVLISRSA